jgi:SSS family solute:Na+ symporter
VVIWFVATQTDIAWPWYCLIGGAVNIAVALIASRLIDGRQTEWSEYSIKGQQQKFRDQGLPEKEGGWYVVPGKVDRASWYLLGFFVLTLIFLATFEAMI